MMESVSEWLDDFQTCPKCHGDKRVKVQRGELQTCLFCEGEGEVEYSWGRCEIYSRILPKLPGKVTIDGTRVAVEGDGFYVEASENDQYKSIYDIARRLAEKGIAPRE